MHNFAIAIDGESGSGKGTLAETLANYYRTRYLPTGNIYRALAKLVVQNGVNYRDENAVYEQAQHIDMQNISSNELASQEIAEIASKIAVLGSVRNILNKYQVDWSRQRDIAILEGRDIGTTILPNADVKIYLTASIEARARRRFLQLAKANIKSTADLGLDEETIKNELKIRDERDKTRTLSPLRVAEDAYVIDSSDLSQEEVFNLAIAHIQRFLPK